MQLQTRVHGALLLVGIIYGVNYSIAKFVMPTYIQPFGFILLRVSTTTILFWLTHLLFVKEKVANRSDYGRLLLCALFGVGVNQLCFFAGLNLTTPVNASVIMTLVPVMVMLVSYFVLKERLTKSKILGLAVGFTGAVLLVLTNEVSFQNAGFTGDLLILVNATSYSLYLVLVKPLMNRYNAMTVSKWLYLFGLVMVLPFGYQQFMDVQWASIPTNIWLAIIYVIIGISYLAYFLNGWSLKHVNSSVVGIYIYLQPVFASVVSISIGQDTFVLQKLLYALLIFTGVYLVSRQ